MSDKIYCGTGRVQITRFGDLLKLNLHRDDIQKIVNWMNENSSEWASLTVKEKREKVEGKPSHYIELDTWVADNARPALPPQEPEDYSENRKVQ